MSVTQGDAQVLIIDDDHAVGDVLRRILERAGFGAVVVHDSAAAIAQWAARDFDAVLLDLHMPELDGFGVMRALVDEHDREAYTPILVVTGDQRIDVRQRALASGAKDFVQKPFEPTEVVARVRNLIETSRLHRRLRSFNEALTARVEERTTLLLSAKLEVLERLARAGEYRDDMTGMHAQRVGFLAGMLAHEVGIDDAKVSMIVQTAPLHDIGKIGIPDGILLKEGPLTPEEIEIIRGHTLIGAGILSGSSFDLLQTAERIALTHHEHWNGAGYPQGLAGTAIPIEGRIVAVADAFDSLTNDRPYRPACSHELAITEIVRWRARQFDPEIVDALLTLHARGVLSAPRPAQRHARQRPDPALGSSAVAMWASAG